MSSYPDWTCAAKGFKEYGQILEMHKRYLRYAQFSRCHED